MAKGKTQEAPALMTERFAEALSAKSRELRNSMSAQNAAQVVGRPDCPSDEGDLSQRSHDEWIFLNRNKLEARLLREVEEARHRIDVGEFGVCHECGEPISRKRLEALPWAKYCVTCQELVAARRVAGDLEPEEDE